MDNEQALRDLAGIDANTLEALLDHYGEDATVGDIARGPHASILQEAAAKRQSKAVADSLFGRLRGADSLPTK